MVQSSLGIDCLASHLRALFAAALLTVLLAACGVNAAPAPSGSGAAAQQIPATPTAEASATPAAAAAIIPTDAEVKAAVMLLLDTSVDADGLIHSRIPMVTGPLDEATPAVTATPAPSPTPNPVANIDILAIGESVRIADDRMPSDPGTLTIVPVQINYTDGRSEQYEILMYHLDEPVGQINWRAASPEMTDDVMVWVWVP